MIFDLAPDIQKHLSEIMRKVDFPHINLDQVVCVRSHGSRSRSLARIWAFPSIWQTALKLKPHYVIEVLSERFDRLPDGEQTKTLIHELLHIPKTFSGALRPHRMRHFHLGREANKLFKIYGKNQN